MNKLKTCVFLMTMFAACSVAEAGIYSTYTITGTFSGEQPAYSQTNATFTITGTFSGEQPAYSQSDATFTITGTFSSAQPSYAQVYATFTIIGAWAVPPSTPVWVSPAGSSWAVVGYTLNQRPKLWFYCTHPNSMDVFSDWLLVMADDSNFSVNVATYQFSISNAGWQPAAQPVANGTTFYFTPQSDLTQTAHYAKSLVQDNVGAWSPPAVLNFQIQDWTWTDAPISTGTTLVRKVHFDELRNVVANLRLFRNLPAPAWTDATISTGTTLVRKVHLDELRQNLDAALYAVGESTGTGTWTDGNISAGVTLVRAVHVTELRDKCRKP